MEKKNKEKEMKKHECKCGHHKDENLEVLDDVCACGDNCNCGEEEILVLKNNIENLEKKVQLAQAELINYRKRKDEETSNMLKFANMDLILDLLPVIDNFERALNVDVTSTDVESYQKGMTMIYKLIYNHILDTLKKFGVCEIEALDKEFDPSLHEAVMIGKEEDKPNDVVLEVFSKGYTLKGRVIRPSKVKVNNID